MKELQVRFCKLKAEINLFLAELAADFNSLTNHNLASLGNPTGIKGHSDLCVLYQELNSHFEKELASINAQAVPFESETSGGSKNISSLPTPPALAAEQMSINSESSLNDPDTELQARYQSTESKIKLILRSNQSIWKSYKDILKTASETHTQMLEENKELIKQLSATEKRDFVTGILMGIVDLLKGIPPLKAADPTPKPKTD